MHPMPFILISLHVLAGVFWAGSSFTLARAAAGHELYTRLWKPQMGAAVITFLSGAYLWHAFHEGAMSALERSLGIGVVAAILALLLQTAAAVITWRKGSQRVLVLAQRGAAALLALTVIGMAGARYAV